MVTDCQQKEHMPFNIIIPEYTVDDTLQATNVAEDDYDLYDNTVTYAINDTVIYIADNVHWVVRSLANDNVGNIPTGLSTDTKWVKISDTNRWKMFDQKTTSQTFNTDSIEVTLLGINTMDAIALLNVDCTSVDVEVTNAESTAIYNDSISMVSVENVYDWYTYFFAPIIRKKDLVLLDIPPYAETIVNLSINYTGSIAKCGTCLIGKKADLGFTRYGTKVSSIDYSIKEADDFGDFVLTERGFSKTMDVTAYVEKPFTDFTVNILNQFRATPVVYVATEEYSSSYIYGVHKTYEVDYTYPNQNQLSVEVLGLS